MRMMLNFHIFHYKQNCHSLKESQHTFFNSLRLSSAVNHNEILSVPKSESWNAYEIVRKCYITKTISWVLLIYKCIIILWTSNSISLSFTSDCLFWTFFQQLCHLSLYF